MTRIVNKKQLAALYGKSTTTISDWISHGMPVFDKRCGNLEIDLAAAIQWREKYVLENKTLIAQEERANLFKVQRLLLELENKKMLRNLVKIDRIENRMIALVNAWVNRFRLLPKKIAKAVFECKTLPKSEAVIREEIYKCIDNLCHVRVNKIVDKDNA